MPRKKLQLIIRDAGFASRRGAEDLIREGRVTVNGHVVTDPAADADIACDHVKVDGKSARLTTPVKLYYVLHKPRNLVSTFSDPEGRPCLGDLIGKLKRKVFSVGRLDFDAEGLMILTNDGELAERLSHPSNRVPRTYLVKVGGAPDDQNLAQIRKGMPLGEGDLLGDVLWEVISRRESSSWIRVTLFEGKKNELKRIFLRLGHPVRKIRRIAFGPIYLGKLPVGAIRPFTATELKRIGEDKPMRLPPRRLYAAKARKGGGAVRSERKPTGPGRDDGRDDKRPVATRREGRPPSRDAKPKRAARPTGPARPGGARRPQRSGKDR
jgi:23S rRNA pseudouridine2605 synthase